MTDINLPKNLIWVCDTQPGITRKRKGKGFMYIDPSGKHLKDKELISRIKEMVIPPAWRDVWICTLPKGYLQATGRDEKNRKQYRYHPQWSAYSSKNKFSHIVDFADQLPALRRRYNADLADTKWTKRKVIGLATALMDELFLRVGNTYYSKKNETFGLTTLRRKHVQFKDGNAHLHFIGKKGGERDVDLEDSKLIKLLRSCSELPGYELFRYKEGGKYHSVDSADFNEYINEHLGDDVHVSAKDFRTWGGTVLCIHYAPQALAMCKENTRLKRETTLIRLVAQELGNTVSVCRKYYIHPKVIEYCADHEVFIPSKKSQQTYSEFETDEQMVLEILNG